MCSGVNSQSYQILDFNIKMDLSEVTSLLKACTAQLKIARAGDFFALYKEGP